MVKISSINGGGFSINDGLANPPAYRVVQGNKFNEVKIENVVKDNDVILDSTNIKEIEVDGTIYDNIKDFSAAVVGILFHRGGGTGNGGAGMGDDTPLPAPFISSIKPNRLILDSVDKKIVITGSYFTPDMTVHIPNITISSILFISDNQIEITASSGSSTSLNPLTLDNGSATTINDAVEVIESNWVDLRQGGDVFNTGDIRTRAGMNLLRDANGMYFTGTNRWSSWVKMEFLKHNRSQENRIIEWIMNRPVSAMMIGIGSDETNENDNSQFQQMETHAYFNSATNFWGLFGNSGTPGQRGDQSNGVSIAGGTGFYKLRFEDNGENGSLFTLFSIPSLDISDWDNEDTILASFIVGGSINPDAEVIMPSIVPATGNNHRFAGVRSI